MATCLPARIDVRSYCVTFEKLISQSSAAKIAGFLMTNATSAPRSPTNIFPGPASSSTPFSLATQSRGPPAMPSTTILSMALVGLKEASATAISGSCTDLDDSTPIRAARR